MQISCKSDIGRMRSQNQDSVFASDKPVGKLPQSEDLAASPPVYRMQKQNPDYGNASFLYHFYN